jgi:hypothetical protein
LFSQQFFTENIVLIKEFWLKLNLTI